MSLQKTGGDMQKNSAFQICNAHGTGIPEDCRPCLRKAHCISIKVPIVSAGTGCGDCQAGKSRQSPMRSYFTSKANTFFLPSS